MIFGSPLVTLHLSLLFGSIAYIKIDVPVPARRGPVPMFLNRDAPPACEGETGDSLFLNPFTCTTDEPGAPFPVFAAIAVLGSERKIGRFYSQPN